jgi:hypothetical protein
VSDDRRPGRIELVRRSGRASPSDPVGLFDERDTDPLRQRHARHGHQISRGHSTGGSMAEDEETPWLIGDM